MKNGAITKEYYPPAAILALMAVCLGGMVLGNWVYHGEWISVGASSAYLLDYITQASLLNSSGSDFLWSVLLASRGDLICLLLLALSPLVMIRKSFIVIIFLYRSFLFGFCGAYMIERIGADISFARGCAVWIVFFLYHVALFAVFICFAVAESPEGKRCWQKRLSYFATVCGELSLVIVLNMIYYFLISRI